MAISKAIVRLADETNETVEPKKVVLLRVWEVARAVDYSSGRLADMIEDPEIATPPAEFSIGGSDYWTTESLPLWKELVDKEIEAVNSKTYTKQALAELVLVEAKKVKSQARRAYARGRGSYSKTAAREAITRVEGILAFVTALNDGNWIQPEDLRREIFKLITEAKAELSS